jgi:hypothetical protein
MEEPVIFNNSTLFIGIDLGDEHSFVTILDPEGEWIEERRIPSPPCLISCISLKNPVSFEPPLTTHGDGGQ